jgi:hypothetical protein
MRTSWISIRLIPQVAAAFQRPTVQMTNNGAFQRHTDAAGHQNATGSATSG